VGQGSRLEVSWCDGAYRAVVAGDGEVMMCPWNNEGKHAMLCDAMKQTTAAVRCESVRSSEWILLTRSRRSQRQ
jgi:hypothetical protein